ncbi:MAG: ABC transporter permease [Pirellulaceae bacterium]
MTTILRIEWLNLKRDYVALGLSLVLPVVFFTISALVFSGMDGDGDGGPQLQIVVIDLDRTPISRGLVVALRREQGVQLVAADEAQSGSPPTPDEARQRIRHGDFPAALIIPSGFGAAFGLAGGEPPPVQVLYDASNPIAKEMASGLIQSAALSAGWDRLVLRWLDQQLDAGSGDEAQRLQTRSWLERLRTERREREAVSGTVEPELSRHVVPVTTEDVRGEEGDIVSYSAAGIGVMFLLFSMSGAGGSILEEVETGTLERLLNSAVSLGQILLAKWLFFTAFAVVQLSVMFAWGAIFFGVDLASPRRLAGFLVMTCVTAGAAAAFGIFLATVCRTRSQLGAISTILILIMSALGGSMVPRFLMPDFMKVTSRLTFNGWALDGYLKVFWYGDPRASLASSLLSLTPQLAVLGAMTVILLSAAYFLSRRWLSV